MGINSDFSKANFEEELKESDEAKGGHLDGEKSTSLADKDQMNFFKILFLLISKLDQSAVNT